MPMELQHSYLQQIGSTWRIKLVSSQAYGSVFEGSYEEKMQASAGQVKEAKPLLV